MSDAGRRYAILIGSSRFDKEPLQSQPLQCPERDIDGLHPLLAAQDCGAFDETFVFKNADNHAVLDRIEEVLTAATRADQVLIYYSGHGITDLPGRLYLTTPNTEVRKLFSTAIPIGTLREVVDLSACRRIILILDCCYGGAAGKSFTRGDVDEKLKELGRGHGIYILTASTAAQTAQEREGDDYGLLTKHIIAGIKEGAAANDDGLISMDGLYRYVYQQVTSEGYQEPMRWALNVKGEDLIIARSSKSPSREQQRLLSNKMIESRPYLPPSIFAKVFQIIDERRAPFYGLLDDLYRQRLEIGEFIEEWYRIELSERQQPIQQPQQQPHQLKPQAMPDQPRHEPAEPELPKSFTEDLNGVLLEMIYVPGGTFKMGSPPGVGADNERPQHTVTVPSFYISKFQVTQKLWKAVIGNDPSGFKGDDLPVETISWEEARVFCRKLSQMTKRVGYRLPTEAEWEYACRAGTEDSYAGVLDMMAWYDQNSGRNTNPVGRKEPNDFGLHDMHGNVWEWCEDIWHKDYKDAPTDGSAWISGGDVSCRMIRGGCYAHASSYCRSASRGYHTADQSVSYYGFRVVMAARTS